MKHLRHCRFILLAFFLCIHSAFSQPVADVQQTLITKSTATWCGECGTWSWTFFESLQDSLAGKVLLVAAHIGDSFLENEMSLEWAANLGISDQPEFYVNEEWQYATGANASSAFQSITDQVEDIYQSAPLANVGLETAWNGDQIDIKTRVLFFQSGSGAFYLGVYLLENQVMAAQAGHSGWVPHQRLLRASVIPSTFGNLMASGTVAAGAEFSKTFTISTDPYDLDNLDVMAVIWKKEGSVYKVVNAWSVGAKPLTSSSPDMGAGPGLTAVLLPNPLSGEQGIIRLHLEGPENVAIDLTSADGRKIGRIFHGRLPAGRHEIPFDSSRIPSEGWYALHFRTELGKPVTLPFIRR